MARILNTLMLYRGIKKWNSIEELEVEEKDRSIVVVDAFIIKLLIEKKYSRKLVFYVAHT